MYTFLRNNKSYVLPAILFSIYLIFTVLTWGKWGHVIADCFREALIPQALLEGKVLYSDITCIYPPLAYQLNALLFKIFGSSLNVLYSVSIICSITVLSLLYYVTKRYSSDLTAFTVTLSVMEIFTFRVIILNSASWFFPYSYSFLYAFTSCFIAFILYIFYKNTENKRLLYYICFLIGLSSAFKLDFLLFIILPLYELIKNKLFKNLFLSFIFFMLPMVFSYTIWFLFGGSVEALSAYKDFLVNFAHAPSVIIYNQNVLIQNFSQKSMAFLRMSSIGFVLNILQISIISSVLVLIYKKVKNNFLKIAGLLVFSFISYYFVIRNVSLTQLYTFKLHFNLVLIPYLVIFSALIIYAIKYKERNYTSKEKFYFLLAISAFLMSYRILSAVFISYVGNFIMIVYWLAFIFFLMELIPEYIPSLKKNCYKKLISLIMIMYGFTYSMVYVSKLNLKSYKIQGKNETFYTTLVYSKAFNDAIKYIEENAPENAVVLTADEGNVINYFSGRKNNLKYYALIPHMVDTYGEEKIIDDLSKNPPDYVLITNNLYPFAGYFGINYAKKITAYFFDNYDYVHSIKYADNSENFEITVLKKK